MENIDIVGVKTLIAKKKLEVRVENNNILLCDTRSGERVRIGKFSLKEDAPCEVCGLADGEITVTWMTEDPQGLTYTRHTESARFCPHCGRPLNFVYKEMF